MIDKQKAQRVILWAAIEDYAGLWELVWELNTAFPDADESEKLATCQQVTRELISDGHVELFRCEEPDGNLTKLPTDEALTLLSALSSWKTPDDDATSLRVSATTSGEKLYHSL
jgi:hypothetical protein